MVFIFNQDTTLNEMCTCLNVNLAYVDFLNLAVFIELPAIMFQCKKLCSRA